MRISDWRSDVCSSDLVTRLFSEDGAEEFFFRRHRALALRRDLTYQNVARLHLGSDIDDARLIEVAKGFFTDIRDVAGNVFLPHLCVAGHDFKFLDMDRVKDAVLHDPFRDQDGVLVGVSVPGPERDGCVPAQSKLTQLGGRTIGNDATLLDDITHFDRKSVV